MSSSPPVLSNSAPTTPLHAIYHCYPTLKGKERLNSLSKAAPLKNIRVGIQTQISTPTSIPYPALLWDEALKFGLGCRILAEVSHLFRPLASFCLSLFAGQSLDHSVVSLPERGGTKIHSLSRCLGSSLSEICRSNEKKSLPKIRVTNRLCQAYSSPLAHRGEELPGFSVGEGIQKLYSG